MSIRPIDFQVMLPKTSEVSKINNEILHKEQIIHQQENVFIQKEIDRNLRQVNEKQEPYKITSDDRGNKNTHSNNGNAKGKNRKIQTEKKDSKDMEEPGAFKSRIDIRI